MATDRSFSTMLNQYVANPLLREELVERNWLMKNCEKDESWLSGDLIVPFKGAQASSVAFGSLTASNDVGESVYVRGSITTQPEMWATVFFNQKDIYQHGKLNEQNLLKLLPDALEDMLDYSNQCLSLSFLNGANFAKLTADGAADGTVIVDRIERFQLKQKVSIDDDNSSPATGYVQTINIDTSTITLDTTRAGGVDLDCSPYTTAQNAKIYFDGSQSNGFTSLRASLLSSTNGGSSTLYGQTKTNYPYLQAVNISGSTLTAVTLLQGVFDAFVTIKNKGKGMPNTAVMSYLNWGFILTTMEAQKGAYHIVQDSSKVTAYGWDEMEIFGPKGRLKFVAVQEMDNDVIYFLDMRPNVMKIYSNGGLQKRVAPDGKEYFETRATTGYTYLVDFSFMGDFVLLKPSYNGVLHSLSIS